MGPQEESAINNRRREGYFGKALALGVSKEDAQQILDEVQGIWVGSTPTQLELTRASERVVLKAAKLPHTPELQFKAQVAENPILAQLMVSPMPGDMVLLRIEGWVGKLVWALQAINGDLSPWTHVGIMLEDDTFFEAQPGGAVITPWEKYKDRPWAVVTQYQAPHTAGPVAHGYVLEPLELTWTERMRVTEEARRHVGTGYNWTTYFYLAAYRLHIRPEWLKRRVRKSSKFICSQAGDLVYSNCEIRLFDDGRMSCDLTPGDLARLR